MTQPPATSQLRGATGLDDGARKALLRVVISYALNYENVVGAVLSKEAYGDLADYLAAIRHVWGPTFEEQIRQTMHQATCM